MPVKIKFSHLKPSKSTSKINCSISLPNTYSSICDGGPINTWPEGLHEASVEVCNRKHDHVFCQEYCQSSFEGIKTASSSRWIWLRPRWCRPKQKEDCCPNHPNTQECHSYSCSGFGIDIFQSSKFKKLRAIKIKYYLRANIIKSIWIRIYSPQMYFLLA